MCVSPLVINGKEVFCHKCWQCKEWRVDNVVGRCIAEQRTSAHSCVGTLTYGGDNRQTREVALNARFLAYRDIQLYLKKLREVRKVRYLVAGEYGDQKGRGHWHIILFSQMEVPNIRYDTEMYQGHRKFWTHGFTHWKEATYEYMRYACAYVLKAVDARNEKLYGTSRHPPLGREYFRWLALRHVEQGLSPQNLDYFFPEIRASDGRPKPFKITRRSAEWFIKDFIDGWLTHRGKDDWPQSDLVEDYLDLLAYREHTTIGHWLDARRWEMQRIEGKRGWLRGVGEIGIGLEADRAIRSKEWYKDDALVASMGNRKGQTFSGQSAQPSPTKSKEPVRSHIRLTPDATPTLVPTESR